MGRKRIENIEGARRMKSSLECIFCKKHFNKVSNFKDHYRTHSKVKPFQCDICGKSFTQKSNMKAHKKNHRIWPPSMSHTIPSNSLNDALVINSKTHQCTKHKLFANVYECPFCKEIANTFTKFRAHVRQHKDKKVLPCSQLDCIELFENEEQLLEHKAKVHEVVHYRCKFCDELCPSMEEVKLHERRHCTYPSKDKVLSSQYKCTDCHNVYTTPEALKHHMLTCNHHYKCPTCDRVFKKENALRRHLNTHTTMSLYSCDVCNAPFNSKNSLRNHKYNHGEAKFICTHCKAAFKRKCNLTRHVKNICSRKV